MIVYQGKPGTSTAALYTSDRRFGSFQVAVTNTSGAEATITINLCQAGAAASTSNEILHAIPIQSPQVVMFDFALEVNQTDVIRGLQGTSNALTVTIDGLDMGKDRNPTPVLA